MSGTDEVAWLITVADDEHLRFGNQPPELVDLVFASLHARGQDDCIGRIIFAIEMVIHGMDARFSDRLHFGIGDDLNIVLGQ